VDRPQAGKLTGKLITAGEPITATPDGAPTDARIDNGRGLRKHPPPNPLTPST
jgi:hypothetical protein